MRLKIIGFRCHVDREFTFPSGGIHRVSGPSGSGKSTIFAAIYWCLFGSMQHVYNNAGVTNKCSVTLELDSPAMTIYRQKRPELLRINTVQAGQQVALEDLAAQQFINSTFGSREIWQACCYIIQNQRSYLITASQADKMELLNTLSFSNDDPDVFISRIESELIKVQTEFTTKQAVYEADLQRYNTDFAAANLDMSLVVPADQRDNLQKEIANAQQEQKKLQKDLADQQRAKGVQASLVESQTDTLLSLGKLPESNLDVVPEYESEIELLTKKMLLIPVLTSVNNFKNELDSLDKKLAALQAPVVPIELPRTPTDSDVAAAALQQKQYDDSVQMCKTLNCPYDSEKIALERDNIAKMLETQPRLQTYSQIQGVVRALNSISGPTCTDADVTAAREALNKLQASTNILKCPHCTKPIRNINGKLMPGECDPASHEEIAVATRQVSDLTAARKRAIEIDNLQAQLKSLLKAAGVADVSAIPAVSGSPLPTTEVTRLKGRYDSLGRITLTTPPTVHPNLLRQVMTYTSNRNQLEKRRNEVVKELAKLEQTAPSEHLDGMAMTRRVNELKGYIAALHRNEESRRVLNKQLDDINHRLAAIVIDDTVAPRLTETNIRLTALQAKMKMSLILDGLVTRQQALEKDKIVVDQFFKELTTLQRMKSIALEEECRALQSTVDSINVALSELAADLFDDPISISVQLFKTLKTKDRTKPTVNLAISYRGGEYDNVSQLSGGEGDRVSLALILALARLNTCPLLLLDECLASLDGTLKEACMKILRRNICQNKTVLVILHDTVEGHYDTIIDAKAS